MIATTLIKLSAVMLASTILMSAAPAPGAVATHATAGETAPAVQYLLEMDLTQPDEIILIWC